MTYKQMVKQYEKQFVAEGFKAGMDKKNPNLPPLLRKTIDGTIKAHTKALKEIHKRSQLMSNKAYIAETKAMGEALEGLLKLYARN